jgi:ergothioneine biosynthesis protein EgtB
LQEIKMSAAHTTLELRHDLLERLSEARLRTDRLFDILKSDSLYERPIPERHRIMFYVGHLEAFDWNLLSGRLLGVKAFHAEFNKLFAFGIDPVGGGLPNDQPEDWPAISEVNRYVNDIRSSLDKGLERVLSGPAAGYEFSPSLLLNVAIEHRLMHAETLAYMFHQLPFDRKIPQSQAAPPQQHSPEVQMIEIPTGIANLGLSRNDRKFGWDNEYEQRTVEVPAFAIDKFMVSNGEYLEFMKRGGYEDRSLWSDADWQWRTTQNISHPVFWTLLNDQWFWRGMFEATPLPPDWPVYVSHAEASAYARWAGKALPTEAQWHRAAYGSANNGEREYPWGKQYPTAKLGNFDFERWDPAPVSAYPAGESALGVSGLLGNGWEWTATEFGPFSGFEPFPFYRGYSADFFDGKHYVMKGGSPRTAACMLRPSFRNWFQSHYQYVYAGFRCVSH